MPNRTQRELWVGSCTAAIAVLLVAVAVFCPRQDIGDQTGSFQLKAEFNRIDGLTLDSPVRMAGVDVGRVSQVTLTDEGRAEIEITLFDGALPIPIDTAAVIETDGLFGEKYVELHPGGEFDTFAAGQRISYTQDSVVLENLLNQIVSRAKAQRKPSSQAEDPGGEP